MNKKNVSTKGSAQSEGELALTRLFDKGNFFALRKYARGVIIAQDSREREKVMARHMLFVTSPDVVALGAGLVCLLATAVVAFLSAYKV